ncbi:glycosyltransferase [Vibrio sp. 1731]|uniref:glycosyltransferase n=1 Tax=Vibrio sp. 1731 TaxID=3074573 RepID=UPI0021CF299A|nr:glycosyltransferase [Vibrio sp. 1731]MDW2113372.1 glycosyltransferase [Vibrio sp. 1731]
MKVLVIPSWHPLPSKPLWCTWILPHIEAIRNAGHDVYILQININEEGNLGNEIEKLEKKHLFSEITVASHKRYRNVFLYPSLMRKYLDRLYQMYQLVETEWGRPDVIHAHVSLPAGFGAGKLGKKIGVPTVVTEHYSGFESDMRYPWRLRKLLNEMVKDVSVFSAVSQGFADRIRKTGLNTEIKILENPINCNYFSGERVEEPGVLRLVTIATSNPIKGVDILLKALERIDTEKVNWRLTIIGDFDKSKGYELFFKKQAFRERIIITGKVPKNEVRKRFLNSDVYIVSSRSETANVSMLEAMSCGVPVITTSCGGPESLLTDKVSIVVKRAHEKELHEAIMKLQEKKLKFEATIVKQFVKDNYSTEVMANKISNLYSDIVSET